MDIKENILKLKELTKSYKLTLQENEAIELAVKTLNFIEEENLKNKFELYFQEFSNELTQEQKEYVKALE